MMARRGNVELSHVKRHQKKTLAGAPGLFGSGRKREGKGSWSVLGSLRALDQECFDAIKNVEGWNP